MKKCVIDFNDYYFQNDSYPIIKEFCIISIQDDVEVIHRIVKPPSKIYKNLSKFIRSYEKNYYSQYGIKWNQGNISLQAARHLIIETLDDAEIIFVKSKETKKHLITFTGIKYKNIINLVERQYRVQSDSLDSSCNYHKDDKTGMCAQKIALQMVKWLIKESVIKNETLAKKRHQLPGKASSSRMEVAVHDPVDNQVDQRKKFLNPLKRSRNSSTENLQLQKNFENKNNIFDRDSDVDYGDQRQKRRKSLEISADLESEDSRLQEDQPRVGEPHDKVANQILEWSNESGYQLLPADANASYENIPDSPKSDYLVIDDSDSEDVDTNDEKIESENAEKIDRYEAILNDEEFFDQFINDIEEILESEKDNE